MGLDWNWGSKDRMQPPGPGKPTGQTGRVTRGTAVILKGGKAVTMRNNLKIRSREWGEPWSTKFSTQPYPLGTADDATTTGWGYKGFLVK